MLNVGYFTHSNISPSETFIYDLIKGLSEQNDIQLTYISGAKEKMETDLTVQSLSIGYAHRFEQFAFRIRKLGQMMGGKGDFWKMRFNKWLSLHQLQKTNLPKFDVAYIDYATSGVLLMEYLEKKNIPFIVHVHGYDVTACLNDKAYSEQLKILFEKASHFITPSQHLKRLLVTLGCDNDKITSIYPITNLNIIEETNWYDQKSIDPTVVFLGRLTDKKNPIALIYAFKLVVDQIPNARLKILGDGPMRKDIELLISKLDLGENIWLSGAVNRETAFQHLRSSYVYAQHSVTSISGDQEGFPVSLAEAAAHALPLVSTIHSGITENIIDGITGFLVQEYDYKSMAEKIIYLIRNPDIAEQMGKAGREQIMKLCESNKRIEKIASLLKEVSGKY